MPEIQDYYFIKPPAKTPRRVRADSMEEYDTRSKLTKQLQAVDGEDDDGSGLLPPIHARYILRLNGKIVGDIRGATDWWKEDVTEE
ncbi:MAG: hypothetical protein OXH41_14200 [Chloroflexi bacterium]|nr:hypothetical protein [Chloroflexota bacterium]